MSKVKLFFKYIIPVSLIVIVVAVSLIIINYESVMKGAIWGRKLVNRGNLNRQSMINFLSERSSTGQKISFIPGETVAGERIGSLYFYQMLAGKGDVEKFMKEYDFAHFVNKKQRLEEWNKLYEYFKKSELNLPEYKEGNTFAYNTGKINMGLIYIYMSKPEEKHSRVLVTIFCIRI